MELWPLLTSGFSSSWSFYRESVIQVYPLPPTTKWIKRNNIALPLQQQCKVLQSTCFISPLPAPSAPTICTCYAAFCCDCPELPLLPHPTSAPCYPSPSNRLYAFIRSQACFSLLTVTTTIMDWSSTRQLSSPRKGIPFYCLFDSST